MWGFYGNTSSTPEEVANPVKIPILKFKPSNTISEADFNNASNTFLAQDTGSTYPTGNTKASYTSESSHTANLLTYGRFNIVHKHYTADGLLKYDYDGCFFTWAFQEAGTNIYYWSAYSQNINTYSHCPAVAYRTYTNPAITRDRVKSMSLIATSGNGKAGIGTVRPLWTCDMSGIAEFNTDAAKIQSFLGPVIPAATIDEWLKYTEDEDDDAPAKPTRDPVNADSHSATSANWEWLNNFKIMNIPDELYPKHLLIDGEYTDMTSAERINNYFIWNNENDASETYHLNSIFVTAAAYQSWAVRIKNINDYQAQLGSDTTSCYKVTGENKGYFGSWYPDVDQFSGGSYQITGREINIGSGMTLDNRPSGSSFYFDDNIITTGSKTFTIRQNYPNSNIRWYPHNASDPVISFGGVYICRCRGHYYYGGPIRWGTGMAIWGFVLLCQIDALDTLPGYGGSEPGDPDGVGIGTEDLNDLFGDGSYTAPNNTTEKDINDKIGTSPINDGSAYNPDGTPRDPAEEGMGDSTGEKETNPIDSHQVENTHDGSMGNGTGDLHQDDTKISDPESTIPQGIDTPGTVSGSGVLSVFTPSFSQLQSFTSELLSNSVLSAIHNYFTTNPMDGIFGLHMLPYSGFASATTANPRIGTHNFSSVLTLAAKEFMTVDYGTINVPFVYNGFENYAPLSDAKIFLPFLGMKDIDINIIQGCNISLKYIVSLTTGDIYAYLYAQWASAWGNGDTTKGVDHLIYHWQGNCAATIPLSHLDNTNYISGAMQVAGGITSLITGAATANPAAIASGIGATAAAASEFGRTSLITSGNLSGMAAFMGCREPYLLLSRPIIAFSEAYNHYLGQRSNAVQAIGQLRPGTFTKMVNIDLSGVGATDDELAEIDSILKGGFYV